jgi:hypothetical protein
MKPAKYSVAVAGNGLLLDRFVLEIKRRFPAMIIYDRNEEAKRPPSNAPIPSHPEVSDVDAVFMLSGSVETVRIQCQTQHRFFNYDSRLISAGGTGLEIMLKRMVQTVEEMLWPREQVIEEPEATEDPEEAEASEDPIDDPASMAD